MNSGARAGTRLERTLHRDYYLTDEIFTRERDRIFWREWFCVGRDEEVHWMENPPAHYMV